MKKIPLIFLGLSIVLSLFSLSIVEDVNQLKQVYLEETEEVIIKNNIINDFVLKTKNLSFDIKANPEGKEEILVCGVGEEEICDFKVNCSSNSMSPIFTCNDYLKGYNVSQEELAEGDIIIFETENKTIIHRIIKIDGDRYITKGDRNKYADRYETYFQDILYKIYNVEYK